MTDPSIRLWILRHGQTAWSAALRHTGRTDIPLTSHGEDEARAVGKRLPAEGFDLVLCSPLRRARRTAELAGLVDVLPEPDAVEWDYGDYEGLTREEIQDRVPGWSPFAFPAMPGGETLDQVAARARRVLLRIRRAAADRASAADPNGAAGATGRDGAADPMRVLVVAHGHFLRVLATCWTGQPTSLAEHLSIDETGLGLLGDDRGTPVIVHWNM